VAASANGRQLALETMAWQCGGGQRNQLSALADNDASAMSADTWRPNGAHDEEK